MCSRTVCPTCERPSYAGCGRHVEQVLHDVAPSDRCQCNDSQPRSVATRRRRSWFGTRTT